MRGQCGLALAAALAQPREHRRVLGTLGLRRADALEAVKLAVVVLHRVLPAAHGARVFHRDVGVLPAAGLDQRHQLLVVAADDRVGPVGGGLEIAGQRVAAGRTRIPGDHHEVARAQRLVGELEEVLRPVRHVVGGERGRFAVLADIRAVEREVAGVARPHPVVDLAAVVADAARRRVHQPHVGDLEVAEQAIAVAAGEAVQAAAEAGLCLAARDQLLLQCLQRRGARKRVRRSGDCGLDLFGHVLDRVERIDARVRSGGDFRGRRGGVEAVAHEVLLGRRVELDGAISAVVIGDHQAGR